jgi:hypothetical protein
LIEYVRLALVPFVVIFDEDYGKGRIDALQASRKLVKGKFLLLAFAMMFFMALPWGVEKWIQGEAGPWIWENPVRVSAGIAASLVINVLASVFMYAVYRGLSQPALLPPALVQPSN